MQGIKMHDKMTISAYILKIVEKDKFLMLQMRAKGEENYCVAIAWKKLQPATGSTDKIF